MKLLHIVKLFYILENKFHGYVDGSTFVAIVPSLGERVAVTESLIFRLVCGMTSLE